MIVRRLLPAVDPVGRATGVIGTAAIGRATGTGVTGLLLGTGIGLTAAKKPGELKELTGGRCWTEGPKPVFTGEATGLLTELVS